MFLASISTDLKLHNCENWNLQFTLGDRIEPLKSIRWSDDARYIAQVGCKSAVDIFSVTEESARRVQQIPIANSTSVAFYKGGPRNLAIGTGSGETYVWDTKINNTIKTYAHPSQLPVTFLDFNTKNTYLAASSENGDTAIYGITTNSLIGNVNVPHSKRVSALKFHKEFRSVLGIATEEGSILLKDLSSGKDKMFLKNAHNAPVTGISFSPINKDVMVSCSYDEKLHVHDIRLQTIVSTISSDKYFTCVDINNTGILVCLGSKSGHVLVYDLRSYRKPLQSLSEHKESVNDVAFQPSVPKGKKGSMFNLSLKDTVNYKSVSPQNRNNSYLFDRLVSPREASTEFKVHDINISDDSFLAKVVDQSNISHISNGNDSKALKSLHVSFPETHEKRDDTINSIPASTPILARVQETMIDTPSPILKNVDDVNGNSVCQKQTKCLSPDCGCNLETLRCDANRVTELSEESKKYIRYTVYDVLGVCRRDYVDLALTVVKNRLFMEDQFSYLIDTMQQMQQTQNQLLEENKRLLIELEMLRISKQ